MFQRLLAPLARLWQPGQSLSDDEQFMLRLAMARSTHWNRVRAEHLRTHGACEACGRTDELNVHHVVPFHIDPALELDPANLITLCEHASWNCHLQLGHGGNWTRWRKDVRMLALHFHGLLHAAAPLMPRKEAA